MGSTVMQEVMNGHGDVVPEYHQIDHVPCSPGLVSLSLDHGEVMYTPILCWQVYTSFRPDMDVHTSIDAVTHEGVAHSALTLYPDGKIRRNEECYNSVPEWLESERESAEIHEKWVEEQKVKEIQEKKEP